MMEELDYITLFDEDGNEEKMEVIDFFKIEDLNQEYIVVTPADIDIDEAYFLKRIVDENGDVTYETIDDEEEFNIVAETYELLGEELEPNMKDCTKDNLAWRVECEYGATSGKTELASCAKRNGLDAIHDTVHEMARDEARHGKALEGLLKRYFGK